MVIFWVVAAAAITIFLTVSFLAKFAEDKKPYAIMLMGIEISIVGIGSMLIKNFSNYNFILRGIGFFIVIVGFTTCIFGFKKQA